MEGIHIEKAVLSACSTALGMLSSEHVSPNRARFCVVAYMGISRIEAALISFLVVRILCEMVRFEGLRISPNVKLHFLIFPNCGAELLLDVADTEIGSAWG